MSSGVQLVQGDLLRAQQGFEEALRISARLDLNRFLAAHGLTLTYHLRGEHERALVMAESLADYDLRAGPDVVFETFAHCAAALARAGAGAVGNAEQDLAERLGRLRRSNVPGLFECCLGTFACIAVITGEFERASRLFAASGPMYRGPEYIPVYLHYTRAVRAALDDETVRRCRAEGAAMSREAAIAEALRISMVQG
jgi:hypothetical protein